MQVVTKVGIILSCGWLLVGCADVTTHVRSRAARDLACGEGQTQVLDSESGVYRVSGCGLEASYRCEEDPASLRTHCERLYVAKIQEPSAPKSAPSSSLAKTP